MTYGVRLKFLDPRGIQIRMAAAFAEVIVLTPSGGPHALNAIRLSSQTNQSGELGDVSP